LSEGDASDVYILRLPGCCSGAGRRKQKERERTEADNNNKWNPWKGRSSTEGIGNQRGLSKEEKWEW
jgi:hypothetical protein